MAAQSPPKEVEYQFMGPLWPYTKNETCLTEYPYKDQNNLAWWFCIKSSEKQPTILLLGNSFANQLYPGFIKNPRLSHHTVLSIGTCSVGSNGVGVQLGNPCYGNRAKEQAEFIDEIVTTTPSLKYVIIDGLSRNPSPDYIERVSNRVSFLESQGLKVVIFTPHLKPDFHPRSCFKSALRVNPKSCLIPASERNKLLEEFLPLIKALKSSSPNTLFFEQNDVFCDRNDHSCSFVRDGLPLHRDEVHTSEYSSILLQDYFSTWAEKSVRSIFE
jgi:hypothetical protein